jgi:hypothetical protein
MGRKDDARGALENGLSVVPDNPDLLRALENL